MNREYDFWNYTYQDCAQANVHGCHSDTFEWWFLLYLNVIL